MDYRALDNVIPLIPAVTAYRTRLLECARQSEVADFVAISNAVTQIDRWLIKFAYPRIGDDYWSSGPRATE